MLTIPTVKPAKPALAEGINGGWLLPVVAAQSVSVLGTQLAPGFGAYEDRVLFFCLAMWLGGGMLYIWIISLIFYRYTFFLLSPWISARHMPRITSIGIHHVAVAQNNSASPLNVHGVHDPFVASAGRSFIDGDRPPVRLRCAGRVADRCGPVDHYRRGPKGQGYSGSFSGSLNFAY